MHSFAIMEIISSEYGTKIRWTTPEWCFMSLPMEKNSVSSLRIRQPFKSLFEYQSLIYGKNSSENI